MANISLGTLSKLRCIICSRYLSHFPIYSNSDGSLRCGRCDNSSENLSRNEIFELLVENTRFPCIYDTEGCTSFLIPSTMEEHEKFCPFQQMTCFKSECKYSGCWNILQSHLINEHNIELLETKGKNNVEIRLETPREINLAVENFNQLFYINMQIEYHQINIKVVPGRNDNFDLKLKLTVKFLNVNDTEIEKLECLLNQTYKINTSDIKWENKTSVKCVVQVEKEEIYESRGIKRKLDVDYGIIDHVKCSKCENYILPPIFQCISGHNICSNCKELIKTCPLSACKSRIDNTRNYSLESLLKGFNFPCPYQNLGCTFVDKTEETEEHLKNCSFLPQTCPAHKCEWKNSKLKLLEHVKERHIVMPNSAALKLTVNPTKNNFVYAERFIIAESINLFKLVYLMKDLNHYWSVKCFGDQDKCKSYSFAIDLVDLSGSNQKLMMQNCCSPLKNGQTRFLKGEFVQANHQQILDLMGKSIDKKDNNVISFHVHIN